nr:PREDICTED: bromodomain-containing protein DDB_G0270170 [Bemisia tabaci]
MDCLDQRENASSSPPQPFHYLANESAKSFVVLQELQNEVGALLEFRDLVMETFPHLRQKMAITTTPTSSHIPVPNGGASSGSKWEPGVRVRRKLGQHSREDSVAPSLVPRSRSNSNGKGPKSGEGSSSTGSAVQDSGFCTESKEHSAASSRKSKETDDELWNLLDVIHQKGTKLRLEVEQLQQKLTPSLEEPPRKSRSLDDLASATASVREAKEATTRQWHCGSHKSQDLLQIEISNLKKERDALLDRIAEMEAENLSNLAETTHLHAELDYLSNEKHHLEEQLNYAISSKAESSTPLKPSFEGFKRLPRASAAGNSYFVPVEPAPVPNGGHIYETPAQRLLSSTFGGSLRDDFLDQSNSLDLKFRPSDPVSRKLNHANIINSLSNSTNNSASDRDIFSVPKNSKSKIYPQPRLARSRNLSGDSGSAVLLGSSSINSRAVTTSDSDKVIHSNETVDRFGNVGALDGIVSSPCLKMKLPKGMSFSGEKLRAILNEFNPVELQRHLITTVYRNQVFERCLKTQLKKKLELTNQLDKVKEDNEELKFQLEEKKIELEGTKARVRVLEKFQDESNRSATLDGKSEGKVSEYSNLSSSQHILIPTNPILPHLALPATHMNGHNVEEMNAHHSSSTESAHHEDDERSNRTILDKNQQNSLLRSKKPSKIPLKSYVAPKQPTSQKTTPNSSNLSNSYNSSKSSHITRQTLNKDSLTYLSNRTRSETRNYDSVKNRDVSITTKFNKSANLNNSNNSTNYSMNKLNSSISSNETVSISKRHTSPISSVNDSFSINKSRYAHRKLSNESLSSSNSSPKYHKDSLKQSNVSSSTNSNSSNNNSPMSYSGFKKNSPQIFNSTRLSVSPKRNSSIISDSQQHSNQELNKKTTPAKSLQNLRYTRKLERNKGKKILNTTLTALPEVPEVGSTEFLDSLDNNKLEKDLNTSEDGAKSKTGSTEQLFSTEYFDSINDPSTVTSRSGSVFHSAAASLSSSKNSNDNCDSLDQDKSNLVNPV